MSDYGEQLYNTMTQDPRWLMPPWSELDEEYRAWYTGRAAEFTQRLAVELRASTARNERLMELLKEWALVRCAPGDLTQEEEIALVQRSKIADKEPMAMVGLVFHPNNGWQRTEGVQS